MRYIAAIVLLTLFITACEKDPETGELLITVEYDGFLEENVEVWLFDSYYGFEKFEYLEKQFSDENGEVYWSGLLPGWYYFEAEITKPINFTLSAIDSIEVVANTQKNRRLILEPIR